VARSVHCKLFAEPAVLKQICESIVLPNLRVSAAGQPGRSTAQHSRQGRLQCTDQAGRLSRTVAEVWLQQHIRQKGTLTLHMTVLVC
jgi:hypothetical protein